MVYSYVLKELASSSISDVEGYIIFIKLLGCILTYFGVHIPVRNRDILKEDSSSLRFSRRALSSHFSSLCWM
jgi:hypothetical protein